MNMKSILFGAIKMLMLQDVSSVAPARGRGSSLPGVLLGTLIVGPTSYRSQSEPVLLF